MDVVYTLGNGSLWKNRELMYSLRSVEKYLSGYDNIYIIGEDPGFLKNEIHIPFGDNNGVNKSRNIFDKIMHACADERISDDFFYMADDHLLLQPQSTLDYPFYFWGTLQQKKEEISHYEYYRWTIKNTIDALGERKLPTLYYNIHSPIVYNKQKFSTIVSTFDWDVQWGYAIKSLYCNSLPLTGQPLTDCAINEWLTREEITGRIQDRPFFSVNDKSLTMDMRNYLANLYPDKIQV